MTRERPAATKDTAATTRTRSATKPAPKMLPEDMLQRAMAAQTPRSRAIWARKGLSTRSKLNPTTQAMLLRQLYLAHFEDERFELAIVASEQAVVLDVLPDVAHQDAARAKQANGDIDGAAMHLRLAARSSPPNRRAFHWWTLGSLYYLNKRYDEAIAAFLRAARWGTTDKPLYQAHLALARIEAGQTVPDVDRIIERLADVPSGGGYGRFVLGLLAIHAGRRAEAKHWLESFIERSTSGRRVMAISLRGEIEAARLALENLSP